MKHSLSAKSPLPIDPTLPYFAYGSLKHDEIAWKQIEQFVRFYREEHVSKFILAIMDGTAYAIPTKFEGGIRGDLVFFSDPTSAYQQIARFEGLYSGYPRYFWTTATAGDQEVNLLQLNRQGNLRQGYLQSESWTIDNDPVFVHALRFLHRELSPLAASLSRGLVGHTDPKEQYWYDYFRLQNCILFINSFRERLELYRIGATTDEPKGVVFPSGVRRSLTDRRLLLAAEPEFKEAMAIANVDREIGFHDYRSPTGRARLGLRDPMQAWTEVRNNITHHAKGSEREVARVLRVAVDQFNTLLAYTKLISPRLAANYQDLTFLTIHS